MAIPVFFFALLLDATFAAASLKVGRFFVLFMMSALFYMYVCPLR
jgi:hypothetical protein